MNYTTWLIGALRVMKEERGWREPVGRLESPLLNRARKGNNYE